MIGVKPPPFFGLFARLYRIALIVESFMQYGSSDAANSKRHLRHPFSFVFAEVNPCNTTCVVRSSFAVSSILAVRHFAQVAYAVVEWVLIYVVNFSKHRYAMMHSPDNAVSEKAITVYATHLSVVRNIAKGFLPSSLGVERLSASIVWMCLCCSWPPDQLAFGSIANQQLVEVVNGR